jgi:hypothetical protein
MERLNAAKTRQTNINDCVDPPANDLLVRSQSQVAAELYLP